MKKALLFLVIIIFVVSAVLGFQAAERLKSGQSSQDEQNQNLQLNFTQKNYLLVHVDDLTAEKPHLVAAWGLFVFYSQPPQVMLIPLYPTYDEAKSAALTSAFRLEKNADLSSRFVDELEKKFDITAAGYVMVDNAGLAQFYKWLTQEEVQVSAANPATADEKHIVLLNGQQFFQRACSQFSQSGTSHFLDQIRWGDLLPAHFSTNLAFESLALAAENFKTAGNLTQCTVLSNE